MARCFNQQETEQNIAVNVQKICFGNNRLNMQEIRGGQESKNRILKASNCKGYKTQKLTYGMFIPLTKKALLFFDF